MGCGGSKDGASDNKEIDSSFETIKIGRYDDFFSSASGLLDCVETIRSGIEDSKEKGHELANTWKLQDAKYYDVIQVLFWAMSAENGGQIAKTSVKVTSDAPFYSVDYSKVHNQTYELSESFSTFLKTLIDGPKTIKEAVEKLQEMAQQAPELVTEGKTEIQGATHLNYMEKAQAISRLIKNSTKLAKELKKTQALVELLKQTKTDLTEMLPKLIGFLANADETGAKAAAQKLVNPGDIFDKFHTGVRKPEKQIESEVKAQEAAKNKAAKGKDGKEADKKSPEKKSRVGASA